MHQHWGGLVFLHWPLPVEVVRAKIPAALELDTFDGQAWLGLTPFALWGARPSFLPPMGPLSRSYELNVRTYVRHGGVSGVWFFSLEASNWLAVLGARLSYRLPYRWAEMEMQDRGGRVRYTSRRKPGQGPPAEFEATWRYGDPLGRALPGSLEHFLIERYFLYTAIAGRLFRAQIHHRPWPLRAITLEGLETTLLTAHGLPRPNTCPIAHAQAAPLHVRIWPLRRVS